MKPVARAVSTTLVQAVMNEIVARIGELRPIGGTRLPAIRGLASSMGVSKTTVVEAYQRLVAEGVVTSRRGSGFFVADMALRRRVRSIEVFRDRAVDPYWLTFQAFGAASDTLKPGSGSLPDHWMPQRSIQKALREISRAPDGARTSYDTPLGFAPMRELVSRRLAERGVDAPFDQILVVDSASQALDFICRLLIEPGDRVLVDDPCFYNFRALLAAHGAEVVSVPMTPDGADLASFATALVDKKPRFYLTNSGFHNPTGARLSPASAHRLLKLADAHDLIVVEDDVFADLEHEPAPRLAAFDGLSQVICIGGFSKTVSGAIRCGYIAARPDWIASLLNLKLALSFSSGRVASACVHSVMVDTSYRRHCEAVRTKLAVATRRTLDRLAACGVTPWLEPSGGMFVWTQLPEGRDADHVARRALEAGVVMAPGRIFSASPAAGSFMRFNVAACAEPRIFDVLKEALD